MPRKRTKVRQEPPQDDIFAALARHGTHNFQEQPTPAQRSAPAGPSVEQLQAQITALTGQIDDMNRRSMMRSTPAPAPQPAHRGVTPADVQLDLTSGMPDPSLDPQAYHRTIQDRVAAFVKAQGEAIVQRAQPRQDDSQATADRLWNDFSEQYPEWAEYGDIVQVVAQQVVQREQAKGIDGQLYVIGNTSTFFKDVAAELGKKYGALIEGEDDDAGDEPEHEVIAQRREDPFSDDGRTAGVFGGQESGGKPNRGRPSTPEPGSDMIADLQQMQVKTGYY